MSDYLANLAARSIGAIAWVRPRVPGIYEPPSLAASLDVGDTGDSEKSLRETGEIGDLNDVASAAANPRRSSEYGSDELKKQNTGLDIPPAAVFPNFLLRNVVEVSPIPGPSSDAPKRQETLSSDAEKEDPFPQRTPRFSPNTFDLVTFFQENWKESTELPIASDPGPKVATLEQRPVGDFQEASSFETRDETEPRMIRSQARQVQETVEPVVANQSGTRGKPGQTLLPTPKIASSDLPQPLAPRLEDVPQVVVQAAIRNERLQTEVAPTSQEGVRPPVFPHPIQREAIAESRAEAHGLEIPKSAPRESQPPRLQAIWCEPRPPAALLHRPESAAQPGRRHADGQVSNASNPTVQVTIGRIEVRASAPQIGSSARARTSPEVMGLKEYLGRRAGRREK